uniref:Uncharacterized protein n=1 Tax=Romanomermis culicivorax TaxID=13658 RepID=A0A915HFJ5_ROMCU
MSVIKVSTGRLYLAHLVYVYILSEKNDGLVRWAAVWWPPTQYSPTRIIVKVHELADLGRDAAPRIHRRALNAGPVKEKSTVKSSMMTNYFYKSFCGALECLALINLARAKKSPMTDLNND